MDNPLRLSPRFCETRFKSRSPLVTNLCLGDDGRILPPSSQRRTSAAETPGSRTIKEEEAAGTPKKCIMIDIYCTKKPTFERWR